MRKSPLSLLIAAVLFGAGAAAAQTDATDSNRTWQGEYAAALDAQATASLDSDIEEAIDSTVDADLDIDSSPGAATPIATAPLADPDSGITADMDGVLASGVDADMNATAASTSSDILGSPRTMPTTELGPAPLSEATVLDGPDPRPATTLLGDTGTVSSAGVRHHSDGSVHQLGPDQGFESEADADAMAAGSTAATGTEPYGSTGETMDTDASLAGTGQADADDPAADGIQSGQPDDAFAETAGSEGFSQGRTANVAQRAFGDLDADSDDMLTREELSGQQQLVDSFDDYDLNNDGSIGENEYQSWYAANNEGSSEFATTAQVEADETTSDRTADAGASDELGQTAAAASTEPATDTGVAGASADADATGSTEMETDIAEVGIAGTTDSAAATTESTAATDTDATVATNIDEDASDEIEMIDYDSISLEGEQDVVAEEEFEDTQADQE